jgi:hypothetical protein
VGDSFARHIPSTLNGAFIGPLVPLGPLVFQLRARHEITEATVIPAKAGIQQAAVDSRFRGNDEMARLFPNDS